MSVWTLLYNGPTGPVEKDFATWGLSKLTRHRGNMLTDKVTFTAQGALVDSDALFQEYRIVTVKRNGVPWFTGPITTIPRKGGASSESISYEVSGVWWFFENQIFQQQWAVWNTISGEAVALISTAQSLVTVGQDPTGLKEDMGQFLTDVLNYLLAGSLLGLVLPDGTNTGPIIPFATGTMDPDITIPYFQCKDKKDSELVQYCMRWIADGTVTVDYSQLPPVLNFRQRSSAPLKTISVLGGTVSSDFNPTPRYDLQVPAVFLKYRQVNTTNGNSFATQTADIFPVGAPDGMLRSVVMDIDLEGGQATYQKQDVTVRSRPITGLESAALVFFTKNNAKLGALDTGNMGVTLATTVVDPDDPAAAVPGFDVNSLNAQLIKGHITTWMETNSNIVGATATVTGTILYSGSDPTTLAAFASQPTPGTMLVPVRCTITNAQTMTYQQLTSLRLAEAIPVGLAEALYNQLNPLQFSGDVVFKEEECSDPLPPGYIFNTSDGRAEWRTMTAQVLEVTEDVDSGTTTVKFGPPLMMSVDDWVELLRAQRTAPFAYNLDQRTTGKPGGDNPVIGASIGPASSSALPGGGGSTPTPYSGFDSSVGASPQVTVRPGMHNNVLPAFLGPTVVPVGTGYFSAKVVFTYDASNNVTVTSVTIEISSSATLTPSSVTPGSSGGSGVLYQNLFQYTAQVVTTAGVGKASVTIAPLVGGSQQFGICAGAISGPWGV